LRVEDTPVGELLAAHLISGREAHRAGGDDKWIEQATRTLIRLIHSDYTTLMEILATVGEATVS
jgi:hypothetical protein